MLVEILDYFIEEFHLESTYKKENLLADERVDRRKEVPTIKEKIQKLVFE